MQLLLQVKFFLNFTEFIYNNLNTYEYLINDNILSGVYTLKGSSTTNLMNHLKNNHPNKLNGNEGRGTLDSYVQLMPRIPVSVIFK
jgi:hypothetical protein